MRRPRRSSTCARRLATAPPPLPAADTPDLFVQPGAHLAAGQSAPPPPPPPPPSRAAPAPQPPPTERKGPLEFLWDGTRTLLGGRSGLFGDGDNRSLFPSRRASGGLLRSSDAPPTPDSAPQKPHTETPTLQRPDAERTHRFPSWASWRDWKKLTLDVYVRISERPRDTRVRLKQTVALLPVVKLKPVVDLEYRGPGKAPVAMWLDVKLLDCLKWRVRADGSSCMQVRARAPLSDPRFVMDVVYQREWADGSESVKISFRALGVAFLKAPGFGAGVKFPIKFDGGVKSTVRVKKYLQIEGNSSDQRKRGRPLRKGRRAAQPATGTGWFTNGHPPPRTERAPWFGITGPTGIDLKLRCLEYR